MAEKRLLPKRWTRLAVMVLLVIACAAGGWLLYRYREANMQRRALIGDVLFADVNGDGIDDAILGYAHSVDGNDDALLVAVDGQTKQVLWEHRAPATPAVGGEGSSLLAVGDALLVARREYRPQKGVVFSKSNFTTLTCYDLATGKRRWRHVAPPGDRWAAPRLLRYKDLVLANYYGRRAGGSRVPLVVAYDVKRGQQRWLRRANIVAIRGDVAFELGYNGAAITLPDGTLHRSFSHSSRLLLGAATPYLTRYVSASKRYQLLRVGALSPPKSTPIAVNGSPLQYPEQSSPYHVLAIGPRLALLGDRGAIRSQRLFGVALAPERTGFAVTYPEPFGARHPQFIFPRASVYPDHAAYGALRTRYLPLVLDKKEGKTVEYTRLALLDTKTGKLSWLSKNAARGVAGSAIDAIYYNAGLYLLMTRLSAYRPNAMIVIDGKRGKVIGALTLRLFRGKKNTTYRRSWLRAECATG